MNETFIQTDLFPPDEDLIDNFDPKNRSKNQERSRKTRPKTEPPALVESTGHTIEGSVIFPKDTHIWKDWKIGGPGKILDRVGADPIGEFRHGLRVFEARGLVPVYFNGKYSILADGDRFTTYSHLAIKNPSTQG